MRVDELREFANCSVFHHFRHRLDARVPRKAGVAEKFAVAMKQVSTYLWHQVQNGTYPTGHLMKLAWGRVWAPGRTKEDILFYVTSWRDESKKAERRGLRYALQLQEHYKSNPGRPLVISKDYSVKFGKKHTLEGTIDLVREVDGKVELVQFSTDTRPLKHFVKNDFTVTAAAWAARKLLGREPDRMVIHHLPSGQVYETSRTETDYRALHRVVAIAQEAIAAGHLVPVLNNNCIGCPYLGPCERKEWLQ